jgi:putative methionine-R-sulfoxide reductase with GAF domain
MKHKMLNRVREGLSVTADLIQIGLFLVLIGAGAAVLATLGGDVPAWAFALAVAAALIIGVFLFKALRSSRGSDDDESLAEDLEVATTYLTRVDDLVAEVQQIIAGADPPEKRLEDLDRLRDLVFTLIFQGVHSAKGEQVRCVYLEPLRENGQKRLAAKYWQGHSLRVQEMRLHADRGSVAGAAFCDREAVYVPDAVNDARMQETTGGKVIGTILCVPVEFGKGAPEPRGVLSVSSIRPAAFSTADREFISICASVIALIEQGVAMAEGEGVPAVGGERPA